MKLISINISVLFLLISLTLIGCTNSISSKIEFDQFLNKESNGYLKQKQVGDYKILVKYLPPEFLSFLEHDNQSSYLKGIDTYRHSLNFVLKIMPARSDQQFLGNLDQKCGSLETNFKELISIEQNTHSFEPYLMVRESNFGLSAHQTFNISFDRNLLADSENKMEFVLNGSFLELGVNKFKFKLSDIQSVPDVSLNN